MAMEYPEYAWPGKPGLNVGIGSGRSPDVEKSRAGAAAGARCLDDVAALVAAKDPPEATSGSGVVEAAQEPIFDCEKNHPGAQVGEGDMPQQTV